MAFEELLVSLTSKLDERGFKQLDAMESKAIKKTDVLSRAMRNLFVGVIGTFAVKSIMDATVKMDTLNRSMSALAGLDVGGKSQIEYLRKESERLGQSFVVIADSYKSLFAAGSGAGWKTEDIQNVFSSVLEAGTVLGSSQQQIGGALLALEQMISKGKVSMEELRRQLGNALPGAMQVAAKAMGVTTQEFEGLMEKGIQSTEFVPKFAKQLRSEYADKLPKAVGTLRAELERLNNAVFFLQVALFEGDNVEGLAEAVRAITKLISSPAFLNSVNAIGKLVAFLAKNLKLIIGFTVLIGFRRLINLFALWRLELLTTTFAVGSLGAGLQLLVGGQVIAGLRTITAIFMAWLAPLLKVAFILGLILELVDTLRGKDTLTSETLRAMPTVNELTQGEKFQRGVSNIRNMLPWNKTVPTLYDSGKYDKQGNLKTSQATVIINAGNADSQQVANLVRSNLAQIFNDYEEVYA